MTATVGIAAAALVAALAAPVEVATDPASSMSRHRLSNPAGSVVAGTVVDGASGDPVEDAAVILRAVPDKGRPRGAGADSSVAVSDQHGRFRLKEVRPGMYTVETTHIAYADRTDTVQVDLGSEMEIEIRMAERIIDLEPLEVTIRAEKLLSVGFYERRKRGIGTYFTRDDILKRRIRNVSDLLSGVAGMRRTVDKTGRSFLSMRGVKTLQTDCSTQYFLDGVLSEVGRVGIDVVPANDVEGIEIYRGSSELPIQFDVGRAMCGAVLIWTRDGRGH